MIFAKINPPLSMVDQINPFSQEVTYRIGDYMAAIANPYILGADKVELTISFGSCTLSEAGEVTDFTAYHRERLELSGEVIEGWGQDDSYILQAVASNKGIEVESIVSGSLNNDGRFF